MSNTTKIKLFDDIKIPRGYLDTINFDSEQQQFNYFFNHPSEIFSSSDFSPIHEHSPIQLTGLRTTFERANYMMYQFNGKWYYAFVNGMTQSDYNSDTGIGTVIIEFEIDLMQTHLFQIKNMTNLFTVRRHLPNNLASISQRLYDEINPTYKAITETLKYGQMVANNTQVIKWIVFITKRKDTKPMTNGELNPFSMYCFPIRVGKTGLDPTVAPYNVNGQSSPPVQGLQDIVQTLTGNTEQGNSMTNNCVNLYLIDDINIKWSVDANGTVNINDTNANYISDPVECIQLLGATAGADEQVINMVDIKAELWKNLQAKGATEYQLVNSTLCGASIANSYGTLTLEAKNLIPMKDFKLLKRSYATEQGSQVTTLKGYCGSDQVAVQMGIKSTGKSQTILSNSTATYMQANKNAYAFKQQSLNVQQEQLNATQALQSSNLNKNLSFGQRQFNVNYGAVGNAQFAGHEAMGLFNTASNAITQTATGFATGGILGGVLGAGIGLANTALKGVDTYQDVQNRGIQKDRDSYSMEYAQQQVNLQQQQAQQNMDMARKAFASENADRSLQPLTINQMGTSNISDYENDLWTDNLVIWCADAYSVKMANNELQRDGSYTADYYNMSDMLSCRKSFNRIQVAQRLILQLNQAQKEIIEGAFTKGVRFWNFSNWGSQKEFDGRFMYYYNCDATL